MDADNGLKQLTRAVKKDRLASYVRLRGGYTVPMAGVVYWAALGVLGYFLELGQWAMAAFFGAGAIFPVALLFAKVFNNPFIKDRTATGGVLLPAFISMLLFWPMIVAVVQTAPELSPLILAIGMSIHWPVIGWAYGRVFLYSAHAVIRAVTVLLIWLYFPDERLTWLPFSVAIIYAVTIVAIWIDSGRRSHLETVQA